MFNGNLNRLVDVINKQVCEEIKIMEVCGTHTQTIARAGLEHMLDKRVKLLSGPGCPVCVTPEGYIDAALELISQPDIIIVTFGDMIRVRGSSRSMEDCMALNSKIKIVYSPFAVMEIVERNKDKQIVFLAVGFETTAPLIAVLINWAKMNHVSNLSFLTGLKRMPPVLSHVLGNKEMKLDALICPGHVSVIMGAEYFDFIPHQYSLPAVVSGFEDMDVAGSIYLIIKEILRKRASLQNHYKSCVTEHGNNRAQRMLSLVFETGDGCWRGIGTLKDSELILKKAFYEQDAAKRFGVSIKHHQSEEGCQCGEIIVGSKSPCECSMFGTACTPQQPKGPCMVSSEGSCSIYYKYRKGGMA